MPALPFVPLTYKIVLTGTSNGTNWANIFHAEGTATPGSIPDLTTLAASINTLWGTTLGLHRSSLCHLTQVVIQDISSETGSAGVNTTSNPGTVAGTPLPANVAHVVSWKIARRYRGGHPRTYLPGVPGSVTNDARTLADTHVAAVLADARAWLAGINGLTSPSTGRLALVNVSYFKGHDAAGNPILRPSPVVDGITDAAVDHRTDTQRRRVGKPV